MTWSGGRGHSGRNGRGAGVCLVVRRLILFSQEIIDGIDFRHRRGVARCQHASDVLLEGRDELPRPVRRCLEALTSTCTGTENLSYQGSNELITFCHDVLSEYVWAGRRR
jgi:hypothetical protein